MKRIAFGVLALVLATMARSAGASCNPDGAWDDQFYPPGVEGDVLALAVSASGDVYVGGDFKLVNDLAVNYIAKWDGSTWSTLGTGLNGRVGAIAINGSDVYVGGAFTTAGGIGASRITKWDGN